MIFSARSNPPDMDSIQVVSWDVDGTLYSARRVAWHVATRAATLTVRRCRLDPLRELAELGELWGRVEKARTDPNGVARVHAGADRRLELERRWWAPALAALGPRPGVEALLRHFQDRVHAQVILTDYEANYKLEGLGFMGYFGAAYVGERMGSFKPSPVPYRRVLEDFGLAPECLLHIGDRRDTDGAGAAAAGCPSLVLGKDFRSFGELYRMLAAAGDRSATRRNPVR